MNETGTAHLLNVADSPHWRGGGSLARMQLLWLVALLPAAVASVAAFGWYSLRVMGLAVGLSVALDALTARVLHSRDETGNWNSVVLGLLLAMLLPVNASWWLILVGSALTIFIGKRLFGGWPVGFSCVTDQPEPTRAAW